jgi:hypothetical protein
VHLSIRSDSIKPNPATCRWRRQGALTRKSRCAEEQSPERENLHGTFRRLMKVGGFLFSWCVTQNINQKKEKPKSDLARDRHFATNPVLKEHGPPLVRRYSLARPPIASQSALSACSIINRVAPHRARTAFPPQDRRRSNGRNRQPFRPNWTSARNTRAPRSCQRGVLSKLAQILSRNKNEGCVVRQHLERRLQPEKGSTDRSADAINGDALHDPAHRPDSRPAGRVPNSWLRNRIRCPWRDWAAHRHHPGSVASSAVKQARPVVAANE